MADYSRPYSQYNKSEIIHYPQTVDEVAKARRDAAADDKDWTYHTINYESPRLISDICDRIMALELRLNG